MRVGQSIRKPVAQRKSLVVNIDTVDLNLMCLIIVVFQRRAGALALRCLEGQLQALLYAV